MNRTAIFSLLLAAVLSSGAAYPQQTQDQPSFVIQGQQLTTQGRLDDALSLYRTVLKAQPDSLQANTGAGVVLDLLGRSAEARQYFEKAIDVAPDPLSKARAERAMAISWAFVGDCEQTVKYEQMALQYYASVKDYYQQGQIADEAARVCLDHGNFDEAYQWYLTGHDLGLKQPDLSPERKHLWEFRWEHAQARIAARKGNQTDAAKHVSAAKTVLDSDPELAKTQSIFFPYLAGYVALYRGDHEAALKELKEANQEDPFVQALLGDCYDASGQKENAMGAYRKAASSTGHNPSTAFARPYAEKKLATTVKDKK